MNISYNKNDVNGFEVFTIEQNHNVNINFDELLIWFTFGSMNETESDRGSIHLLEHLINSLEIDGVSLKIFLENNNIGTEYRTYFDSMYLYFKSSNNKLSNNISSIFKFLIYGEISEIDIRMEKKVVSQEKVLRNNDIFNFYSDIIYQNVWENSVGESILGNVYKTSKFDSLYARKLLNVLLSNDCVKFYYSGSQKEMLFDNVSKLSNTIYNKNYCLINRNINLNRLFLNEQFELTLKKDKPKCSSIIYSIGEYIDQKSSLILSLIALSFSQGRTGYLNDQFKKYDLNLYNILVRPYYLFTYAFLDIRIVFDNIDSNILIENIMSIISDSNYLHYIENNLELLKSNILDYIDVNTEINTLRKEFLLFLAKENQVNSTKDLSIVKTKSILKDINFIDIQNYYLKYINNNHCIINIK